VPIVRRYTNGAYESTNTVVNVVSSSIDGGMVIDTVEFCSNNDGFCPA
jgi:hypothetical protein